MPINVQNNVAGVQITTGKIPNSLKADDIIKALNENTSLLVETRDDIDHNVDIDFADQYKPAKPVDIPPPVVLPQFKTSANNDLSKYAKDLDGAGTIRQDGASGSEDGDESGSGSGKKNDGSSIFNFLKIFIIIVICVVLGMVVYKNRALFMSKINKA